MIDLKLFSGKLKKLQEQLNINADYISKQTGIKIEKIKSFELAETEPTGDEILILADFFKCDYNFFISNETKSSFDKTEKLYRKFGNDFTTQDRLSVLEFIFLCECEDYVNKCLGKTFQNFSFIKKGTFHKQQGIDAAASLRSFLGYDRNNIPRDIYYDFRKLGIHIFRRKLSNSNISGLFIKHDTAGKCVLVNYVEDVFRQKFTVAHEVAHAILDENEDVTVSFRGGNDYSEIRANNFASAFLVPPDALKYLAQKIYKWNEVIIVDLARQLQVNVITLLISLKENGIIDEHIYDMYRKLKVPVRDKVDSEFTKLPPRLQEAKKILIEEGLSTYYVRSCHDAYINDCITAGRLAEMLLTSEERLPLLLNLYNLQLRYEH